MFLLVVAVSSAKITLADDPPESQLARGKDEVILAGIEVYKTPMATLLQKLGRPTEKREVSVATHGAVGERLYIWKKPNITIRVGTNYSDEAMFSGDLRE